MDGSASRVSRLVGKLDWIAVRHQIPIDAILNHLGRATMQAPDHRLAARHRFQYTRPNPSPRLGKAKISHAGVARRNFE